MSRVRVLVVDDSATMRGLISASLRRDPEIEVVGSAGDPLEARAAIKALDPDVITLDVEMPNMNGIDFLERLMRLRPMPVVMVSTLTQRGAEITLEALEIGAVDCVGKPVGAHAGDGFDRLAEKVKAAARARVRTTGDRQPTATRRDFRGGEGMLVALGASTGGVEALITVLSAFPANCPPTVITQHMPANFTTSFAARLDRICAPKVQEAHDGAPLSEGMVYLAPGGERHLKVAGHRHLTCQLVAEDPVSGHRPSVDVLFHSVAATGRPAVGAILTGMGKDGADGLLAMRQAGARTFGQDEASCVVYGMPRAAYGLGAVEREAPLDAIGGLILDACESLSRVN
ncbi:chemotaxis-specific protein-glutamate methyltransferase CheB [Caulobacter sp. SLTY]|uniref:protein-glutamate methylesterase/protein-glutamine glutaminase n=1 Tax=Caulobacter sp. SLTY TaxID=2683262 RepID=UPI001412DCF4|nr:chemotaxis response regulator protein-glutamate methylesterase [Caulobacter sp. SLTY]NBB15051.1 chemotaxis-specific protein-glutamate methyltransferase CheB [Caulobacter sp. SLTY]